MLPSVSAPKRAVVWASPCPLAAAVSGAEIAMSLVMGEPDGLKKMLHCTMAEERAAYRPALLAWPSLILALSHANTHDPQGGVQIVTWVPTSTTRPVGIWK